MPFYVNNAVAALLFIVGSLNINTDLQVLKDACEGPLRTEPINGLNATDNISNVLYDINYPINMAGNSNGLRFIRVYLMGKNR